MNKFIALTVYILIAQISFAQAIFKGKVIDATDQKGLFQAKVSVMANNAEVLKLLTDFDGSFAFKLAKNTAYTVKASFAGCKDTIVKFQTDKKGNATRTYAQFTMQKDGLRLVGKVLDGKTKMPIEAVDVILKNTQTREETRFTTAKSGAYNLKLQYETNYRVNINKRSPGIANRYEDTVFYISTIGFNLPLDYPLDILLRPAQKLSNRTEYTPSENKAASKPVIEVQPTLKNTEQKNNQ